MAFRTFRLSRTVECRLRDTLKPEGVASGACHIGFRIRAGQLCCSPRGMHRLLVKG